MITLEFLTAPQNTPFAVALGIMVGVSAIQGVSSAVGHSLSDFVDSWLPESDVSLDGSPGPLGWLLIGKLPLLVVIILFLTLFGVAGLLIQQIAFATFGRLVPAGVAVIPAAAVAIPSLRLLGAPLARIIPREETSAISRDQFVGRVATIVIGTARRGHAAEAKFRDQYGQTHFVMVEPDEDTEAFETGTSILLVRDEGTIFKATRNQHPDLQPVKRDS